MVSFLKDPDSFDHHPPSKRHASYCEMVPRAPLCDRRVRVIFDFCSRCSRCCSEDVTTRISRDMDGSRLQIRRSEAGLFAKACIHEVWKERESWDLLEGGTLWTRGIWNHVIHRTDQVGFQLLPGSYGELCNHFSIVPRVDLRYASLSIPTDARFFLEYLMWFSPWFLRLSVFTSVFMHPFCVDLFPSLECPEEKRAKWQRKNGRLKHFNDR
ncbi:hypothetical protein MVEG_08804 [Podila verticillata NRRL 6337]|nr:hypothetical protein MVEG_08804 [Podila verticillata NRRL 6337]